MAQEEQHCFSKCRNDSCPDNNITLFQVYKTFNQYDIKHKLEGKKSIKASGTLTNINNIINNDISIIASSQDGKTDDTSIST